MTTAAISTMTTPDASPAEQNASTWAESIAAAYEVHQFCAEEGEGKYLSREAKALLHELGFDGTNHSEVAVAIESQCQEQPLSVDVRSGWQSPTEHLEPDEFQILLSTGGPALRIVGSLRYGEPDRCWLEHQDWGTPWVRHFEVDLEALMWFSELFWFGA